MNITQIRASGKLVEQQFKDLGYDVPRVEYKMSTRMTRALGNCKTQYMGMAKVRCVITISSDLPITTLNDTMAHEMVHAVAPRGAHHGYPFKAIAQKINRAYGYTIDTTANEEESDLIGAVRASKGTHTTLLCSNGCSRTHVVSNRSRAARYPSMFRCKCGGELRVA